ncbi:hypothetical protein AB1K62_04675 [Parasphingorhabdus sp. JC815]|uniref:hypothetical protein n=1 Tax=Parasphingorhabdus sp. JC815 TaxID=3232140 RepID=UPI00345AA9FF
MTRHIRSKQRILTICKVNGKMTERDYLRARKDIVKREASRDQLGVMTKQMLDMGGCLSSATLAAKMEFGHRLISLNQHQKQRIAQDEKAAAMLLSKAHLSKQQEEQAAQSLRATTKSFENRQQQNQPVRTKSRHFDNREG